MKAGRFLKKKKPPALMLTSLLDMFTIILIFLIVSFDAQDQEFRLNPDLTLPESSARAPFRPAVNVSVADNRILIGDEVIADLPEGAAGEAQYDEGQIPDLVEALTEEYRTRYGDPEDAETGGVEGDEDTGPIVLIQADRELEYRTLYLVLRSAAQAGFFRYRLAVMKT